MNRNLLISALTLAAASLMAAETTPKDEVTAAAKKLTDKGNYSWKTTTVVPESNPFKPGPTEGKTEKDGISHVSLSFGDNTTQFVVKGEKGAITSPEGGWQSLAEAEKAEGPIQFMAMIVRKFKTPADQAAEVASFAKELKKTGDSYASELTEAGAKKLLSFGRDGEGPAITNPKGSVKIWIKDGLLNKYELKLAGSMDFNGNNFDLERTMTIEIKDVGTTKLSVPEEAKKKLS
jgi:hypothetical protein